MYLGFELSVEVINNDRVVTTQMPRPGGVGHLARLIMRVVGAVESALVERLLEHAVEVLVEQREQRGEEFLRVLLLEAAKVGVLLPD